MHIHDATIIGAGPAGIAAAIQLKRYGLEFCLLEKESVGGLLKNANLVENYPGFVNGISGIKLVELFQKQLKTLGIRVSRETVQSLDWVNRVFVIKTNEQVLYSRIAVLASGTKPKQFTDIELTAEVNEHVYYDAYPLRTESDRTIVIVGAGDAAFDYALNLSARNNVMILNRGTNVKCLPLLQDRVSETDRITYYENTALTGIRKSRRNTLIITCIGPAGAQDLEADILVFATGREPNLDFVSQEIQSYHEELTKMSVLHIIGDLKNNRYRQTAIAAGDGIKCAMMIYEKLKDKNL